MRKRVEVTYEVVAELSVRAERRENEEPRVAVLMVGGYRALAIPEALELIAALRAAIAEASGHGS